MLQQSVGYFNRHSALEKTILNYIYYCIYNLWLSSAKTVAFVYKGN